jgi:hypothetical protein
MFTLAKKVVPHPRPPLLRKLGWSRSCDESLCPFCVHLSAGENWHDPLGSRFERNGLQNRIDPSQAIELYCLNHDCRTAGFRLSQRGGGVRAVDLESGAVLDLTPTGVRWLLAQAEGKPHWRRVAGEWSQFESRRPQPPATQKVRPSVLREFERRLRLVSVGELLELEPSEIPSMRRAG